MSQPSREAELGSAWDDFMETNKEDLTAEYIQRNYKDFKEFCEDRFGEYITNL